MTARRTALVAAFLLAALAFMAAGMFLAQPPTQGTAWLALAAGCALGGAVHVWESR